MDLPKASPQAIQVRRANPPVKDSGIQTFLDIAYDTVANGWIRDSVRDLRDQENREKWKNRPRTNRRVEDSRTMQHLDEVQGAISVATLERQFIMAHGRTPRPGELDRWVEQQPSWR